MPARPSGGRRDDPGRPGSLAALTAALSCEPPQPDRHDGGGVGAFLDEQRVVVVRQQWARWLASPDAALVRDPGGELWAWTYAKSQKVRNLERDPRATLQVEDGEQYHELRGVMIEARPSSTVDTEMVAGGGGRDLSARYGGGAVDAGVPGRGPGPGDQAGGASVRGVSGL